MGHLPQKPSRVHLPTLGLFLTLLVLTALVAVGLRWAVGAPSSGLRQPATKSSSEAATVGSERKK